MADYMIGTVPNDTFVDKRRGRGNASTTILAEGNNMSSVSALRTRLTALSAAYTSTRLNQMTVNDMIYALRMLSSDSAGIK